MTFHPGEIARLDGWRRVFLSHRGFRSWSYNDELWWWCEHLGKTPARGSRIEVYVGSENHNYDITADGVSRIERIQEVRLVKLSPLEQLAAACLRPQFSLADRAAVYLTEFGTANILSFAMELGVEQDELQQILLKDKRFCCRQEGLVWLEALR